MLKIIDLSHPIEDLMSVYPGDEPLHLDKINDIERNGFNNFRLSTGMHAGTHIDGPMHMTSSEKYFDRISAEQFIGSGCLLNAAGEKYIQCKQEYESAVKEKSIVLIYTGFSVKYGSEEYYYNHPIISRELAQIFIERHVKMICLDSPSPDSDPFEIHKLLLNNDVLIGENLINIDKLLPVKQFEVIAMPLNIHADSSPARIVARILK